MQLKLYQPQSILKDYVQQMTYIQGFTVAHEIERLVPDGSVNLIFSLDGRPQYIFDNESLRKTRKFDKVWLSGMLRGYITISSGNDCEMLVVSFLPGKSYPFIGIPLHEIDDEVLDADVIFGDDIMNLRDQLIEEPEPLNKFLAVENWLLPQLCDESVPGAVVDFFVQNIINAPTVNGLSSLIDKSGYSQKQLIHNFKKHVGLTPKYFQRIIRFNMALGDIYSAQQLDWAGIANDCGYFDQAHFIKDFNHFAGINPEQYLKQKGEYSNYIPLR